MRKLASVLLYSGIVAAVVGFGAVHAATYDYDYTGTFRFGWSLAYILLLAMAAYGVGLPDLPDRLRSAVLNALAACGLAALAISAVQLLAGDALLPRFVVFGAAIALVPWEVACSVLARQGRSKAEARDRVLFVGADADLENLARDLDRAPERPARVVSHVPLRDGSETVPSGSTIVEQARSAGATVVVLAREAQSDPSVVAQAALLHESGVRVRTLSLFYEQWLGKLPLSELERVSLMFDIGEVHRQRYGRAKRIIDIGFGLLGFVVLVVALPFVIVGNAMFNRGPLFFRQPRVGKGGRVFTMLKLRTMRPDDRTEGEWTAADDPRVTPLGRLLRTSHLDELPQVVNIVRGDLSVVGPRPEQPHYVEELTAKLPFYGLRHLVRPGLTGWAQVKYGYASDDEDALEKLQYEFFYLRHQQLPLDLRIVARTVRSVVGRRGR